MRLKQPGKCFGMGSLGRTDLSLMENSRRRERTSRAASALDVREILSSCEVASVSGSVWCSNVGDICLLLALMWQEGNILAEDPREMGAGPALS